MTPAIFLDRDGTIIRDADYLADPAQVELLPGAAEALVALRAAGYRLVCVTNQSGVARGRLTEADVQAVHRRLADLLAEGGAALDACYYSPYHPQGSVPAYTRAHSSRKPGPGMLLQAATDLDLDLGRSWMVGDAGRDLAAGRAAGCATLWLRVCVGNQPPPAEAHAVADTWPAAVRAILDLAAIGVTGRTPPRPVVDLTASGRAD